MKITVVSPEFGFGGSERVLSILMNQWIENNEVQLILLQDKEEVAYKIDPNVSIKLCGFPQKKKIVKLCRGMKKTRYEINKFNPDIIIAFSSFVMTYLSIALIGCSFNIIYSQRNDPYAAIKGLKMHLFEKIAINKSDAIVFQLEGAKNYYDEKIQKKSTIICNPIEFKNLPIHKNENNRNTVLTIGRLEPQKNHKVLVDAFVEVHKLHPEFDLKIYGDGAEKENIQNQINSYDANDYIRLKGINKKVWQEECDSYMFVLSSDYEGLPNVLMEALCVGMPCVSTDCSPGGARVLINNMENGLLVAKNSKMELEQAINYLIENKEIANQIGKSARQLSEKVSPEYIAKQWIDFMNDVLGNLDKNTV